jgi:hypothetical protein
MAQVVELASLFGWHTFHPWLSIHSARGWPDLALVRERLILVELKTMKGSLTPAQAQWQEWLKAAGVETYVFRPTDFNKIFEILQRRDEKAKATHQMPGLRDTDRVPADPVREADAGDMDEPE